VICHDSRDGGERKVSGDAREASSRPQRDAQLAASCEIN
jgi:hypothetical protein